MNGSKAEKVYKVGKVHTFLKSGVIEDVIRGRVWTINDILNAEEITESIVDTLVSDMDNSMKWEILTQSDLSKDMSEHLRKELNIMVSFVLTNFLKTATVDFGSDKVEEESEEVQKPDEKQMGTDTTSVDKDEAIMTLKERIRQDTKLMSEEEKRKSGMI